MKAKKEERNNKQQSQRKSQTWAWNVMEVDYGALLENYQLTVSHIVSKSKDKNCSEWKAIPCINFF